MPSPRLRGDRLGNGKASCMLFNALNAEKLFANRRAIVPWEVRWRTSEDAPNKVVQGALSSARPHSAHAINSRPESSTLASK
jgi:hypothetical protein